jgi:cystathionine beta-lyase
MKLLFLADRSSDKIRPGGISMEYAFDKITDRRNTNSLKYDFALQRGRPADVLPLWVADMDFPTAPCVREALEQAVRHGIFGYSEHTARYFDAVAGWLTQHFGYTPRPEYLIKTPGVVYALAAAVRSLTQPGDSVLIFSPVYYPFSEVIRDNGRTLVESDLVYENGKYAIDFADAEEKIRENRVKLLLFCSPHNPVGRVWTEEELRQLGALCEKYNVLVVADEIHCDFVWPGHKHIMFPTLDPELAQRTVLCTAPSKSFNLAGLQISNIFIENPTLREKFQAEVTRTGYSQVGGLGLVACEAAYGQGAPWLEELKKYLWENFQYLQKADLPGIRLVEPEGTYLGWLDCAGLGLSGEALEDLVVHKARLWLDSGSMFGAKTAQSQRINVACPRKTLDQAIRQLQEAIVCENLR